MAAHVLPGPSSIWGPCDEPCGHTDCAAAHELAETVCPLCDERIGFDHRIVDDREHGVVHADCLLDLYESRPVDYATTAAERVGVEL